MTFIEISFLTSCNEDNTLEMATHLIVRPLHSCRTILLMCLLETSNRATLGCTTTVA